MVVQNLVEERFGREGEDFQIIEPGSVEEWMEHVRTAPEKGFDKLLVAGGDGSVHLSLQSMDFDKLSLGILPTGSGNDIYRAFGVPINPKAALDNFFAGIELVDVGEAGGRYFLNTVGIGLDSWTILVKEQTTGLLSRNYVFLFLKTIRMLKGLDVEIDIGDITIARRAYWVIAANNRYIGGGMKVAPDADMRDGLLDVIIIGETSKVDLVMRIPKIFKGTHIGHPKAEVFKTDRLTIRCTDDIPCAMDGELHGKPPLEIKVHPKRLKLRGKLQD